MKITTLAVLSVVCLLQSTTQAKPTQKPKEIAKICYDTVDNSQFCTTDHLGNVQVFIYNAGWCPPCNSEVHELSNSYKQFEGKAVTFASLSGEGFDHGTKPDKAFLEAWKAKHNIPFVVAGKYKDGIGRIRWAVGDCMSGRCVCTVFGSHAESGYDRRAR